jgi:pimeloyl-ACP methyl ester carboxylesterase
MRMATEPEGAAIRVCDLPLSGWRVRYREAGAGPPVIVATGLGLSGRFYDRNLPQFGAAGLRMIVPDMPGFGATRGRPRGLNVEETRHFLLAFADALGIRRAIWLGHSIGAQAVIDIAAHAPHRAQALVLAGPTGEPGDAQLLRQIRALAHETLLAPPGVVLRVLSDYVRTSPRAYLTTWIRYSRDRTHEELARVPCPTLILTGTRDPVIRSDYLGLLLRRITHARLEKIAGGSHALPRSQARQFNDVVIAFCREVLRDGTLVR